MRSCCLVQNVNSYFWWFLLKIKQLKFIVVFFMPPNFLLSAEKCFDFVEIWEGCEFYWAEKTCHRSALDGSWHQPRSKKTEGGKAWPKPDYLDQTPKSARAKWKCVFYVQREGFTIVEIKFSWHSIANRYNQREQEVSSWSIFVWFLSHHGVGKRGYEMKLGPGSVLISLS